MSVESNKQHYNLLQQREYKDRKKSLAYRLRIHNNFIKALLIQKFRHVSSTLHIFDICCGSGGDIGKYAHLPNIRLLVGMDHADQLIQECETKYNNLHKPLFQAKFVNIDCHLQKIDSFLDSSIQFHLVFCQFAAHYAFESEQRLRGFLSNCSCRLMPGGYLIMTIPNSQYIQQLLKDNHNQKIGDEPLWSIQLLHDLEQKSKLKPEDDSKFGNKYMFHLADSVDCPEPYIDLDLLANMAKEYNLYIEFIQSLEDFKKAEEKEHRAEYEQLYKQMHCETLSSAENRVVSLYQVIILSRKA